MDEPLSRERSIAGLAYLAGAVGLFLRRGWAVWLALAVAGATLVVFAALGILSMRERARVAGGPSSSRASRAREPAEVRLPAE